VLIGVIKLHGKQFYQELEDYKSKMSNSDPQKTYAVVVGIEKYDPGSSWDLPGAAVNALDFAKWLLDRCVPLDNIMLYISELAEPDKLKNNQNFKSLWDKRQKATRENIYNAINEKIPEKKQEGNLLYIYWGGHGISNGYEDRRLFYDDGKQNLNLQSLLQSLKSDIFGEFNQQILIIDACADYNDQASLFPKEEYPNTTPLIKERQQVILFATKEGYRAKNLDAEKTGLFSKVLLEKLNNINIISKDQLLLHENIEPIIQKIQETFKENYQNESIPIFVSPTYASGNQPGKLWLTKSANDYKILEQQWDRLRQIIENYNWDIIKNCCYDILKQFSNDPKSNYIKLSTAGDFDYLKDILLKIEHKQNNDYQINILILQFANYLYHTDNPKNSDLENWINETLVSLNIDPSFWNQLKQVKPKDCNPDNNIYQDKYPYLLITCEPCNSSEGLNRCKLQSELIFQQDDQEPLTKYPIIFDEIDTDYGDICQRIYDLINKVRKILNRDCNNSHELTIELFLPNQYLIKFALEIEKIPPLPNETEPPWFGYEYKLVTRSYNRFQDYSLHDKILRKWDELHQLTEINQKIVCFNKNNLNQGYNWKTFRKAVTTTISINMNVPLLNPEYNCHIDDFLITILRCGFPFSFWLRNGSLESLKLKEDTTINQFEDIFTIDDLKKSSNLFKLIQDVRRDAYIEDKTKHEQYLGYHLGFLFDNPRRLPSKFDLAKGSDILTFGV
jgi:hypothetical protein